MSPSPTEPAWRQRWRPPATIYLADAALWCDGRAWPDLAAWRAANPGRRARAVVGASLLRTLLPPADLPLADDAALRAYARLQFSHYFGAPAPAWPLAVWRHGSQRGACALLAEPPAPGDRPFTALHPGWALALRHHASADPGWAAASSTALAVVEGRTLTWLALRGNTLAGLQQRLLDDGSSAADLQALMDSLTPQPDGFSHPPRLTGWSSDALPGLAGSPAGMPWLQPPARGAVASRWPLPDFARPGRRPPLLASLWLLSAGAACALAAQQAWQQQGQARLLREQAVVLAALRKPPAAVPALPQADSAARGRARQAAQQLHTDWPALWGAVEQALPPGVWPQTLELDARQLRIDGRAADADAVMQLVGRLAQHPSQEVVLTRLQQPDAGAGSDGSAAGLRFEVVRRPATAQAAPGARP